LRGSTWLWLAIVAWIAAIGAGWWTLANYEFRVEKTISGAVNQWPANTGLPSAVDRPSLLFFMHPKCPCTRAYLAELERLWLPAPHDAPNAPQLTVVVTVPWGASDDWYETETLKKASALRGVNLVIDRNGTEARRFGVATSGTVMWFDAKGQRLYSGGITASRGHEGDSLGGDAVAALLRGDPNRTAGLPAFGCRLCLPESSAAPPPANEQPTCEITCDETP
jgi:hypothetical protein